ncbi:MAG TPA: hypothetical protein VF159_07880 [Gemmatimonadaceae bacterium]
MTRLSRLRSLLLAVWVVACMGEPSVLRICPMHATATAELEMAESMGSMAAPPRSAGHHRHGHGHDGAPSSSPSGNHHHYCSCINSCVGTSVSPLASTPPVIPAPPDIVDEQRLVSGPDARPRSAFVYLLPPGTGPPRV